MTDQPSQYLTSAQVATELGIHEQTVHRYFRSGELPGRIIGKTWKTTRAALDAFVEGRNANPTPPLETQPGPTLETKD